jgi:5-methylcytosine-specific restriction protein B
MPLGAATEAKALEVLEACRRYGKSSIIALAGVPGTGKSYVACVVAQRLAGHPTLVEEVQFHPSYTYEEFVEGMRIDRGGGVRVEPGVFLEWNERALSDPTRTYVLLVEELTRANVPAVIGELMTYIEYRDRPMLTLYGRRPVLLAQNLVILATYNPTDRSAIEFDTALLRRMRIIWCPPDTAQLQEMLNGRGIRPEVINRLKAIFDECRDRHSGDYVHLMPFGHGIFSQVSSEKPDLHDLWVERISHMLYRPLVEPHPFAQTIERMYPWASSSDFELE